jgi:hypothetical protein
VHNARAKPTEQPRRIVDGDLVRGHSAPVGGQHGQPAVGRKAGRVRGELEGCERSEQRSGEVSQKQSEALRGTQRHSLVLRDTHSHSFALIRNH